MSLRFKVFFVYCSVLATLFFIVNQSLVYFITKDFSALEDREMEERLLRATDALQSRMNDLSVKLGDWSQWDDTYQFVEDGNEEYVASNLQDGTFEMLRLNIIMIVNDHGEPVFKRYIKNGENKPFPESFERHLADDEASEILHEEGPHEEIVNLPEGTLVYSARQITSSDGQAPTRGVIIFGYFFEQEEVEELARITRMDIRYAAPYEGDSLSSEFLEAKNHLSKDKRIFIADPKNGELISGYTIVTDEWENPVMLLSVSMPRDIYRNGQESIALFTKFIVLVSVLFILLIFLISDRLVLQKLARLNEEVSRISKGSDLSARISFSGKDEFSRLAQEMNRMLSALQEENARRQQQVEEAEQMNRLMVNRELKMIELKKEIKRLQQKHE